ncbi:MAG TPA: hypothetical protein VJ385_20285 [Fibrobacteria bacterium]|nr:hypothetical protein [Fibrobacteria bacterium]
MTRFIEDSLRQRLGHKASIAALPVFDSGIRLPKDFDLESVIRAEENAYAQRVAEKISPYGKPSP